MLILLGKLNLCRLQKRENQFAFWEKDGEGGQGLYICN